MNIEQIQAQLAETDGLPIEIHLATGQRVLVEHDQSVFVRGADVVVLHRAAPDSNVLQGFDVFDAGAILRIDIVGRVPPPLPGEEPAPILAPGVSALAWGESLLAVLACIIICARVGKIGFDYYISLKSGFTIGDTWVIAWWSVLIAIELIVLMSILQFYRHRIYPLPLHYALGYRLPAAPWQRRLLGVFWFGHAVLGVWAFSQLGHMFTNVAILWDGPMRTIIGVLEVVMVFAGAHASMLFLLLAAKSFGASQNLLRQMWRARMLVDLAIGALALALVNQAAIERWLNPATRTRRPYR